MDILRYLSRRSKCGSHAASRWIRDCRTYGWDEVQVLTVKHESHEKYHEGFEYYIINMSHVTLVSAECSQASLKSIASKQRRSARHLHESVEVIQISSDDTPDRSHMKEIQVVAAISISISIWSSQ